MLKLQKKQTQIKIFENPKFKKLRVIKNAKIKSKSKKITIPEKQHFKRLKLLNLKII